MNREANAGIGGSALSGCLSVDGEGTEAGTVGDAFLGLRCRHWLVGICSFAVAMYGCIGRAEDALEVKFVDVTQAAGLDFEHFGDGSGQHYLVESAGGGVATLDYDNDGRVDIYFTNGSLLFQQVPANGEAQPTNRLFRNVSTPEKLAFVDVTSEAGVGDIGFALGATAGDVDNDGDTDLFVTNFGRNLLFQNQGDGTFEKIVQRSNPSMSAGCALVDIEHDGDLDIYISSYVLFSQSVNTVREVLGVKVGPGPQDYDAVSDTLLRNDGQGGFDDISAESGLHDVAGRGMGVVAFDYDADGDEDLYVCNDTDANFLYENDGQGRFTEIGVLAGVAYDVQGLEQGSMGVDCGDVDNDGFMDLVTTAFKDETPTLYQNSGQLFFDDVGPTLGLSAANRSVSWGVAFADFNQDMFVDLFVSSGHVFQDTSVVASKSRSAFPNSLLLNQSGKRFLPVSLSAANAANAGTAMSPQVSRGCAIEDFDQDGDLDILVVNLNDDARLLRNDSSTVLSSVQLTLMGDNSNRSAVGAVVGVTSDGITQWRTVHSGRGYQSHFGSQLHFAIGKSGIQQIQVRWPSGTSETWEAPFPDHRFLGLRESSGIFALGAERDN